MSRPTLRLGQVLRGAHDTYRVAEQFTEFVWLATAQRSARKVVLKSIEGHWRLQNERDVLRRFQDKVPHLRPLVDEVMDDDSVPPTIVLKHFATDLGDADRRQRLTRRQIKHVARHVLETLRGLHENGMVHTDVKLSNILANEDSSDLRFSDIQLGDCGGTVAVDSVYATKGHLMGSSQYRAPEVHLELPWGPPCDIWSFGVMLINLNYGRFRMFNPPKDTPDDMVDIEVMCSIHRYFGPHWGSYIDLIDDANTKLALEVMINSTKAQPLTPFSHMAESDIDPADLAFICRIMQLDPRHRPTAQALLEDEWWTERSPRVMGRYSLEDWERITAERAGATTERASAEEPVQGVTAV